MRKSEQKGKIDSDNILCIAILLTVWFLYAVLSQLTPFLYDNLVFDALYLGFNGGEDTFNVDAFLDYAEYMRRIDNWRLANLVAPLTSVVLDCKPVFSMLTGLCIACMVFVPLSECSRNCRFISAVAIWAGYTLFLPWRNNILTGDYALNYIYSSALCMLLFSLVFKTLRIASSLSVVGMLLLSVIVAAWHEGISVPAGTALLAYMGFWSRGRCHWSVWVCGIILFCGGLAWSLASNLTQRICMEIPSAAIVESPFKTLVFNALCLVLMAAIAIATFWQRLRPSLKTVASRPAFVIFALTAIAGCLLSLMVRASGRTAFWPQACAVAAFVLWGQVLWQERKPGKAIIVAAVTASLLLAQGVYAAIYIKKSADEYYDVLDLMSGKEMGATIYFDIIMPEDYPIATLGMPPRNVWLETFTYYVLDKRYPQLRAAVVPVSLQNVDHSQADNLGLAMRLGDAVFNIPAPDRFESDRAAKAYLDIRLVDGTTRHNHPAFTLLFISNEGQRLQYIKPFNIEASEIAAIDRISFTSY